MSAENYTESFEGKKYAYRQTKDGMVVSFVVHPDDMPKEMATAQIGQRYMVVCAQIDDFENPIPPKATTDGNRAVARANLICKDESYIKWVRLNSSQWHVIDESLDDVDYAAEVLRFVCGIPSRSELKGSEEARQRLTDHLKHFELEVLL
tara:strand:+ start:466 stop:915 length:450 start_codon:yes stop_codon:yes gene_type:complete